MTGSLPTASLVTALLALAAGATWGCDGRRPSGGAPTAGPGARPPDPGSTRVQPAGPRPAVVLSPEGRPEARVTVEIARTPRERERGLMYRRHLPSDDGMLFLFEEEDLQSFWMKNTLIPLDMIFIREDLTVAGVVENAEPLTLSGRAVPVPSRYVLEVNGGWARDHSIAAGTRVRFEHVEP